MDRDLALPRRIWAWSAERFPLISVFSAYLLYALAASLINYETTGSFSWELTDWLGGLALTCHFLLLRVLDEHKDYEQDLKAHPNRVLQSGLISLRHLKVVGLIAAGLSLMITLAFAEGTGLILWGLMVTWTALMTWEFFIPRWLTSHLMIYSVSHMLVLPFMIAWAGYLAAGTLPSASSLSLILALVFCNGLIYEILRKVKAPAEEKPEVDSFSKRFGLRKSVLAAGLLHLVSWSLFFALIQHLFPLATLSRWAPALGLILVLLSSANCLKKSTKKSTQALEGASALFVLISYSTLIFLTQV